MSITINPGTGPVNGATEENATANIDRFAADLVIAGITTTSIERDTAVDSDGRYGYQLTTGDGRTLSIDMPGLPLDQVRYVDEPGQDIWDFPRLYVDGSSWVWMFAIRACEPQQGDEPDDDDSAASADEPPLGDQILADMSLSDTEAFDAAGKAYAADAAILEATVRPTGDPNEDRPSPDQCADLGCDCKP